MKLFNRLFASEAIAVKKGKCTLVKGKMSSGYVREVGYLCADLGIKNCEIWVNSVGTVTFSSEIDKKNQQQFRNILTST